MKTVIVVDVPVSEDEIRDVGFLANVSVFPSIAAEQHYKFENVVVRPLPEKHGRLIDADELKKHKYHDSNRCENAVAVAYIDWADTIIEADTGETE